MISLTRAGILGAGWAQQSPTIVAKVPGSMTKTGDWTSPNNAILFNANYANCAIGAAGISGRLQAAGFGGFASAGVTIVGVNVTIARLSAGNTAKLQDAAVQLFTAAGDVGDSKPNAVKWNPIGLTSAWDIVSYGGFGDVWGATLDADTVNAAEFGVYLTVENTDSFTRNARVNAIQVTVCYAP